MNHYADIDEGFKVFDDEQERRTSEVFFIQNPRLTSFMTATGLFNATKIPVIHLIGPLRPGIARPSHPFDFEEGYLEAEGNTPLLRKTCPTLTVRWSQYGQALTVGA